MKKALIAVFMLLTVTCSYSQNVVREGNTFKTERAVSKADTLATSYQWEDTKGVKYPIIVNKKTGSCYVWKTSDKTGKKYKQYLVEEISKAICQELGITYAPKSKK